MVKIYRYHFLILTLCFNLHFIAASTYYVKSNGDNSLSGTSIANAWRTVGKINATSFLPGDTILFEGGTTFKGNISMGTDDANRTDSPIVFSSYGTSKAIIFGGNSNGFYAYNTAGIEIHNLIFQGSGYNINTGVGIYFYMDKAANSRLKHIVIENTEVYDFNISGIRIGCSPTDQSRSGYDSIIIRNCMVHDNGLSGLSIHGHYKITDTLFSHKHILIQRCKVFNNWGITGLLEHSGSGIIIGQVDSCTVEYCETYENGQNNTYTLAGPAGIRAWDSKNIAIQYCYSHQNRSQTVDGNGFELGGGVRNALMQGNYAHDNHGPGFLVAQYTGARKMKNIALRYNISERDGRGLGALIWNGDPGTTITSEKIDFYNNTIFTDTTGNSIGNAALAVYNNYGAMKNVRICNNIFLTKNNAPLVDIQSALNLKFYSNFYFDHGQGFRIIDNGTPYNSLAIWRSVSGQEIYNGKNTGSKIDPSVINAGMGKGVAGIDSLFTLKAYRLNSNSALIGNGVLIDSLVEFKTIKTDFFGDVVYTQDQYTAGAHEIDAPKAQFSVTNNCLSTNSKFVNRSVKSISSFWKFGDGSTSVSEDPLHIYALPGLYTVTLIVTGKFGYMDSIKRTFEVYQQPVPNFTFSNSDNCPDVKISFTNASTGAISYLWKLDDSITYTTANIIHGFPLAGLHEIKLIATSSKNCKDSSIANIEIHEVPDAGFTIKDACYRDSVTFIPTSNDMAQYTWNISNNTISGLKEPSIYFADPGQYLTKLSVVSVHSCINSFEKTIEIFRKPVAAFAAAGHCFGDTIPLVNQSVDDSLNAWNFGTLTSIERVPRITGSATGIMPIQLKVTSKNKCIDTISKICETFSLPSAKFSYQKISDSFHFKADDLSLTTYQWTINGIAWPANNPKLTYKFSTTGAQKIILKTINQNDCSDTASQIVQNSVGIANIAMGTNAIVYPNPFTNILTIQIKSLAGNIDKIRIMDTQGREIYSADAFEKEGNGTYIFNPMKHPLASGIYHLEIDYNGSKMIQKIIRQ